jgi:mannose-6-phosphate isomerase-like protein (cupin superfamily)
MAGVTFLRGADARVEKAPDGMDVRVLVRAQQGSMATFSLPVAAVGRALRHQRVAELWYVVQGSGEFWSAQDSGERVESIRTGDSLHIAPGTTFQVRAGAHDSLTIVGVTMPPWPGVDEAWLVRGKWQQSAIDNSTEDSSVVLRLAHCADIQQLNKIALRSKAWWGYDDAFLAQCALELGVELAAVEAELVVVACVRGSAGETTIAAFGGLERLPDKSFELSHLFVSPCYIGRGIGRPVLLKLISMVNAHDGQTLWVQADPQAASFYTRCGGIEAGTRPSGSVAGRKLPCFTFDCSNDGLARAASALAPRVQVGS